MWWWLKAWTNFAAAELGAVGVDHTARDITTTGHGVVQGRHGQPLLHPRVDRAEVGRHGSCGTRADWRSSRR